MATDTDMHDEVTLPQFKEQLWEELAVLHHQRHDKTGPGPVVRLDREPRRGRRGSRSLLVGAASVAAAAVLVVVQFGLGGGRSSGPPQVTLEERVAAATEQALADSIMHSVTDSETGDDSESWFDETTTAGRSRSLTPEGATVSDVGAVTPPALGDRAPQPPPYESAETCVPGPCRPEDESDYPVQHMRTVCHEARVHGDWDAPGPVVGSVEFIRQSVDADMLVADGTQVVDGRELLRLRYAPTGGERPDTTILVDPDTYRPVLQIDGPQDITDVNGVAHHFSRRVTRFEYLPRTAENLALLSPPVPDGFTEVSSEELQQVDCG